MFSEIIICFDKKFAKCGPRSQIQSIGDNLSILVYDGKFNNGMIGILRQAQSIKKNKLKRRSIRVQIPLEL